ncbi:peptide deformylase [Amylibacter sp. IMCC11727]|uniref:peptide deformylase n=1 Tax=Amylibacter sp. IMCC11727 TaxID=3039851 RepID=UPI00244E083E|nr:peptide deformylase [Amylibacter sp. IMCC11727]WGI22518.1 peptide deformylase [Amylibacter sp. IMCC11727]
MSVKQILIHPDPLLKKQCAAVDTVSPEVQTLARDMLDTMYDAPGVGLAAPQVGVLSRIFVMDCTAKEEEPEPLVLINPQVVWTSEETSVYNEGCLSLPEMYEDVERPAKAVMQFLDIDGAQQEREFDGLWATCAQHELDHLNGKLFIDYLSGLKRSMITKKMMKLKKERARA